MFKIFDSLIRICGLYSQELYASELFFQINEMNLVSRELEKTREVITSQEVRVKWAQNKLKAEQDAHRVRRPWLLYKMILKNC